MTEKIKLHIIDLLVSIQDYMYDIADILEVGDFCGEQKPNKEMVFYTEIENMINAINKEQQHLLTTIKNKTK